MGKLDVALRDLIIHRARRAIKEVVRDLPSQVRGAGRQMRALQKSVAQLKKQVEGLKEARRKEAPISPASDTELEKARFTKRTLPGLRKRFGLTQQEMARLLEVSPLTVSSWERGKTKPAGENLAKVIALRSAAQEQVDAALDRQPAPPAVSPEQIKRLRGKLGLTQGALAKLLGVSSAAVVAWEGGKAVPGESNRRSLVEMMGMGVEEVGGRLGRKKADAGGKGGEEEKGKALTPEQVRDIRGKLGLSQKELAAKLGVSANSVCNWETGKTTPRGKSIEKLPAMRG